MIGTSRWSRWVALFALLACAPLAVGKEGNPVLQRPLTANWWVGDDFAWVRGANYVPSYAVTSVEQWVRYEPDTVERELEMAERLKLNSLRVWLQYFAYEKDKERFLGNYGDFLSRCSDHAIKPMIVLFDGCFGADPTEDATAWVANPGPQRMTKDHWPKLEQFVADVVLPHLGDPRILFWDVMNEPSSLGAPDVLGKDPQAAWDFARHFCDYVREIDNTHPATVGVGHHSHIPWVWDHVDVVTYHNYQPFERAFDLEIEAAKRLARDKAVLITETVPNSAGQDPEMTFRVFRKHHIGWYFWSLVSGRSPLTFDAVFTSEGVTYWPDYIAFILGFSVPREFMAKRFDRFEIAEVCREVASSPTDDASYEERHKVMAELGRSLGWAAVPYDAWDAFVKRETQSQDLIKSDNKAEGYKLLDENLRILDQLARANGFFDDLEGPKSAPASK